MISKFWNYCSPSFLPCKGRRLSGPRLARRLLRDEAGSYLLYMGVLIPVVIGVIGLGTEGGRWLYVHQTLQNAADSAALSAAAAISKGLDAGASSATITTRATTQAKAIAATYCNVTGQAGTCFIDGQNNASITVNPSLAANPPSVRVTVAQVQPLVFSMLWLSTSKSISASAVAILNSNTPVCALALGKTATGNNESQSIQVGPGNGKLNFSNCGVFSNSSASDSITTQGSASVTASTIGTVGGVSGSGFNGILTTGDPAVSDPFVSQSVPSTAGLPCLTQPAGNSITLSPGRYCGNPPLNADKVDITMQAGTYILDSTGTNTTLVVKNATVTDNGAGVTLVFTCSTCLTPSKYPSVMLDVQANGNIVLTAPNAGPTAGVVLFGDRIMPLNTQFNVASNGTETFNGAVYLPNGEIQTHGGGSGAVPCSQVIANTILIKTSTFESQHCSGNGTPSFGRAVALVE